MIVHFYICFSTRVGQNLYVSGTGSSLGNEDFTKAIPLQYLNQEYWHGEVELNEQDVAESFIQYKYLLKDESGSEIVEWGNDRVIDLQKIKVKELAIIDAWNHAGDAENAFYTKPFQEVLLKPTPAVPVKSGKVVTHEFRVKTPLLKEDEAVCIIGASEALGKWDTETPVLLTQSGNWWICKVNLTNESFPAAYKYGVYNVKEKSLVQLENGINRSLIGDAGKKRLTIVHDGFVRLPTPGWKGAGVAIPVFGLRSNEGLGTGEFTDIKLLVDWAKLSGLKLIQLLPVNDTTATHTWTDSYPYSAISAFALHPLYLNLGKVAGKKNAGVVKPYYTKYREELNALPKLDYEKVTELKFAAIRELYALQKDELHDDAAYFEFFELNRRWLVPYAAFCYLRDKYKTADFSKWKSHGKYDEHAIQQLVAPGHKQYDDIGMYYFTQYHLHLQLKEATAYAHKNGIIVKGDLPIGIYRNSSDAWMAPDQYYMNAQAGAPPDDFAIKGQNWGFPTYNWTRMRMDGFAWWRQRFEQMSEYFDAFRIDHILGFFRIWTIPLHAVEGIMGRFVPAIPVHISELHQKGISFEPHRYCQPFINDWVLDEIFHGHATYVKEHFLNYSHGNFQLKPEFDTQRKVEEFFSKEELSDKNRFIKYGLFDLVSNLIFFEDDELPHNYHFRINMDHTTSFRHLDGHTQYILKELYVNYFYYRQDEMWKKQAMQKLPQLKLATNMLVFGEDLGMVPHCVPDVMKQLGIFSLEIQRMPKETGITFSHPRNAPYLSVVTPSSHDMSTIRGGWEEDMGKTQYFYNHMLGHYGKAPEHCDATLNKEILIQHFYSPAMWSIFQLQDILGMSETLRRDNPFDERINEPSIATHYWQYRMHLTLEDLIAHNEFNEEFKSYIKASGR